MKMRIIQINLGNFGSTGGIAMEINRIANLEGMETYMAYPWNCNNKRKEQFDLLIGTEYGRRVSRKLARLTGFNGCFSVFSTIKFLNKLRKIKPDIVHLHNLHNTYINLPLLFWYIKKYNIKTVWTLHDCWAFTGQCPHFTMAKCNRWKNGCFACPQYTKYPEAKVDRTKIMWKLKKKWFTGVNDMTIVVPSQWLADLVKDSYLKEYPVMVINNGIDLEVFKPTGSDFKSKYSLGNKYVVLGVAFDWGIRKGLDVFIELAKRLNSEYQIILVGTNSEIDKQLPKNIISIHRTQNQRELAEIYTVADVFVNPTREENYPTVNMEALACGTPVITFNTGGSSEIPDKKTGYVIDVNDIDEMERQIIRICKEVIFNEKDCLKRAHEFDKKKKYEEYINLYK